MEGVEARMFFLDHMDAFPLDTRRHNPTPAPKALPRRLRCACWLRFELLASFHTGKLELATLPAGQL